MNATVALLVAMSPIQHEIKAEADILKVAEAPQLANPVCLEVGPNFEIFIAETYRQETFGVPDNRTFPEWLEDDLRLQTVEERGDMYRKHHPELVEKWSTNEDRIVLLRDLDGDFIVDKSTVYAGGFDDLLVGTGAGLLYLDGDVYYTCIPDLWKLRDTDGDDIADMRENMQTGFGVRVALRGHDMHGLTRGPFGRIYWSIGDRGYNITTKEGVSFSEPGRGAVFRSWPDGSDLEVFSYGLRNPQELAFDDYGNLFTVDNNSDAGDRARLVYLYQGSDSGWRMNFQSLPDRGQWMRESWWDASEKNHPQFLNSPLANIAAGPSGLAHYPGVGMGPEYDDSFFLADFRGGSDYSGILRFTVKEDGAGFAFESEEEFWWKVLATDVCFAPDGSMYLSDWIKGWVGDGVGNVFRADFAGADINAQQQSVEFLSCDITELRNETLINLLSNKDKRVRERAQFELVNRHAVPQLHSVAISAQYPTLARCHALWALSSLSRIQGRNHLPQICLSDNDAQVRAQFLRSANEIHDERSEAWFVKGISDASPQVQYFAALGLAHYPGRLKLLYGHAATTDRFVRSALVEAVAAQALPGELSSLITGHSKEQLMLSVLALRKTRSAELINFLDASDAQIRDEAICAIYDREIISAKEKVATLSADHGKYSSASVRRILACKNFIGSKAYAEELHRYASDASNPAYLLEEVAVYLQKWAAPHGFDMLLNEWQEFPPRDIDSVKGMDLDFSSIKAEGPLARGKKIFSENTVLSCTKCHSMSGVTPDGFVNPAGPDLSGIGSRYDAEQILKFIAEPRAESAMPKDISEKISDSELSDLVDFLSGQKDKTVTLNLAEENAIEFKEITTADNKTLYVSTTEVSWDVYDLFFLREDEQIEIDGVTGPSHSVFPVTRGYGHDNMPAIGMTYAAAQNFCIWLSAKQNHNFRLATADEWRAALGEQEISAQTAWLADNSEGAPHLLGQYAANRNGIFDMIGNVEEWVTDPSAPQGMTMGGSFMDEAWQLESGLSSIYQISWQARDPQWPKSSWWMSDAGYVGFRIVTDSRPETASL
ncbi:MAG: SUMF1/EgtB/PvdO family nonheme iron enzyme [Planctomycetota bacterium]|nr:SUMF1/EgtB/PvdO family nonheme iron enzyme [Planctomycetota bacterium]